MIVIPIMVYVSVNQLFNILTMRKQNFFTEEYVAPELEVVSMVVEAGFELSSFIDDVEEDNYGEF